MSKLQIKQKLQALPAVIWFPVGYLLLALLHALLIQLLPVPASMPQPLTESLLQQPVTLSEISRSVERLEQLKKLAEL